MGSSFQPYSFEDFILISRKSFDSGILNIDQLYLPNTEFERILNHASAICFSLNFTTMKYLYLSEGVYKLLGYDRQEWFNEGISFAFKTVVSEDREILKSIHEYFFKVFYSYPTIERKKLSFTFDFRVKDINGKIIRLSQCSSFLELDHEGKPLIDFSICTDITTLKHSGPSLLSIKFGNYLIESRTFYSSSQKAFFSKREREVLLLLSVGMKSQLIAEKLFISTETVYKHRKNMLLKTGCKNTVELINLAKKKEFI